jgi:hypothetical protein
MADGPLVSGTFSDEARTGSSPAFRGLRRATIAASAPAHADFEWIPKFRRDYLPNIREPKSHLVLEVMRADSEAKRLVLRNIAPYSIVIVDFSFYTSVLIGDVIRRVAPHMPPEIDEVDALRLLNIPKDLARLLLQAARARAIESSPIARVDSLLRQACHDADVPFGPEDSLFFQPALLEMDERHFTELVARLGVTLGDAIDPKTQAEAVISAIGSTRHFDKGFVAGISLRMSAGVDRVFDEGTKEVFERLQEAHDMVVTRLQELEHDNFMSTLRPGTLRQEDSQRLLGIQAADIAAGAAIEMYQQEETAREGAAMVRQHFARVLFNDQWI